jgi:hypothetical protein
MLNRRIKWRAVSRTYSRSSTVFHTFQSCILPQSSGWNSHLEFLMIRNSQNQARSACSLMSGVSLDTVFCIDIGDEESPDSSVGIVTRATGCTIRVLMFDSRRGMGIFLSTTVSRTALGPTQPPIQWVPGPLFLGSKAAGAWSWPLTSSSTEVKNSWTYTSTPQYVFVARFLVEHRDNFGVKNKKTISERVLSSAFETNDGAARVSTYS